jgi:DNA-binding transcriptional MerR regulator
MFLTIGEMASESGVQVETIRYYESVELMPKPQRTEGKQRRYAQDDLKRLSFIRHARELGFEVAAIRDILAMTGQSDASCEKIDGIARSHLATVEEKLASLKALRKELLRMLDHCGTGKVADCNVIEVLYDHAKCQTHKRKTSK